MADAWFAADERQATLVADLRSAGLDLFTVSTDEEVTDDLAGRIPRRPANRHPGPEPAPDQPAEPVEPPAATEDDSEWIKRYARVRDLRVEWRDDD